MVNILQAETIEYTTPSLILNTLPLKELSADDFISKLLTKLSISGLLSIIESTFVNSEVFINLDNSNKLCVMVTNESIDSMNITYGSRVSAFCKASSVLIALYCSLI